jgi:predicted amidohydrolase YtcJ
MPWAPARLGPGRIKSAYAYKDLLQQNHWLPLGTDFPVEDVSTLKTFCAAVFRQDEHGLPQGGFQMENALTRQEALMGMTIWAAKSIFEEQNRGSLEPGKWADFVIMDTDLMKAGLDAIKNAKVIATYINGTKVYGN